MNEKTKNQKSQQLQIKSPKFKGKTRIEFFENNQKISEYVNENMMTDYMDEILNPVAAFTLQSSYSQRLENYTPIYDKLLGGIILYSEPIEEKAENTRISVSNVCTGHAGQPYSGANTKRGTYNVNESGYIDNNNTWKGYRHVWDFDTDKANGMISCVCLTTKQGGNGGFGGELSYFISEDNNKNFYNPSNGIWIGSNVEFNTKWLRYLGNINGKDVFACIYNNNIVTFRFTHDNISINLADNFSGASIFFDIDKANQFHPTHEITSHEIPSGVSGTLSVFVYDNKYYIVESETNTTFSYVVFDPVTNSFSGRQSRTVSPGFEIQQNGICFSNGYWFAPHVNDGYIMRYPSGGGQGEIINGNIIFTENLQPFGTSNVAMISSDMNNVTIIDTDTGKAFHRITNDSVISYGGKQLCGNHLLKFENYSGGMLIQQYDFAGGVASINNLSTPITKTGAQTMKITYEITAEEE